MNVLFYLDHSISSGFGGIEHATGQVANVLSQKRIQCYSFYRFQSLDDKNDGAQKCSISDLYIPNLQENSSDVLQKLIEWHIVVIIIQSIFDESIVVWRSLIDNLDHPCKLIFAYHYNPGSEYGYLRDLHFSVSSLITKIRWQRYVKRVYNTIWKTADNVVVLSKTHIRPWMRLSSADSDEKFVVIPNMNSYEQSLPLEELQNKEKIVLIVSRLSEHEKKISRLLKVWKDIEKVSTLNEWKLVIVGDGPDKLHYEQYAKENLLRYEFTGKQPSQVYFRLASIFIMASAQEGWGLVITEAQQMGCVPIVLNTFPSASDLINNTRNGYLVNSMNVFRKTLIALMKDSNLRDQIASNAITDSYRFSQDEIGNKWIELCQ